MKSVVGKGKNARKWGVNCSTSSASQSVTSAKLILIGKLKSEKIKRKLGNCSIRNFARRVKNENESEEKIWRRTEIFNSLPPPPEKMSESSFF